MVAIGGGCGFEGGIGVAEARDGEPGGGIGEAGGGFWGHLGGIWGHLGGISRRGEGEEPFH